MIRNLNTSVKQLKPLTYTLIPPSKDFVMNIEYTLTDTIIHAETSFRLTTVRDALAFALTAEPLAAVVQVFDDLGEKALEQVVNAVKAIEPGCEFVTRGEYLVAGSSRYKCPSLSQG